MKYNSNYVDSKLPCFDRIIRITLPCQPMKTRIAWFSTKSGSGFRRFITVFGRAACYLFNNNALVNCNLIVLTYIKIILNLSSIQCFLHDRLKVRVAVHF